MKLKKRRKNVKRIFTPILEKAGISTPVNKITLNIFRITVLIDIIISFILIYIFSVTPGFSLVYIFWVILVAWSFVFIAVLLLIWLLYFFLIDFMIYKRKIKIEEVFPDFLQLTSANIRAGMPIDQALWHAIRPNFGVLAKEMEDVAKQTMSGTDLEKALSEFSNKYDSPILKRSISLLIEGLNAGGEIGELLDRISTNIQESRLIQREMSASVTTYAIFISVATIMGAPFLLALSSQLLVIIESIVSTIDVPKTGAGMAMSFTSVGVSPADFKIFALVTLSLTSFLSSAIVSVIRKGNVKEGIKIIPIFVISTLLLYLLLDFALGIFIQGML